MSYIKAPAKDDVIRVISDLARNKMSCLRGNVEVCFYLGFCFVRFDLVPIFIRKAKQFTNFSYSNVIFAASSSSLGSGLRVG